MLDEEINSKEDDIRKGKIISSTAIDAKPGSNLRNGGGAGGLTRIHNIGILLVSIPESPALSFSLPI